MSISFLLEFPRRRAAGEHIGIVSACSAHPLVIEAVFRRGLGSDRPVLIEATCNQVNHAGGYTGMTPAGFRGSVERIAARVGFEPGRAILGGDHLGPGPWKHLPAEKAMEQARIMVDAYVRAGFSKIHLDTSMGCLGESVAVGDELTAGRAAELAAVAEAASAGSGDTRPAYVIGTEVPIPGGAPDALDELRVTRPEAALQTVSAHRRAFSRRGLEAAFSRTIGLVVQPGVEFGNENVVAYDQAQATALSRCLRRIPRFVFEAHSTDYQSPRALRDLVADGFAILKVGPGLTFALREVIYGLDRIAQEMGVADREGGVQHALESAMLRDPDNWARYCRGSERDRYLQRHYGYSDRVRYYWPVPEVREAVRRLLAAFGDGAIPATLVSQHLGGLHRDVAEGAVAARPKQLMLAAIGRVLDVYEDACA